MIAGVISIGTNSTRALAAGLDPMHTILARSTGTRVGEGLREHGRLQDDAMQRTLDAVRKHRKALNECNPDRLFAIATSAVRRAENGHEFAREVENICGVPLEILSGEEEAVRSYLGAAAGLPATDRIGVVDTGGGSTEYAVGRGPIPERAVSCEIGAVRLTEAVPQLAGRSGQVDESAIAAAREIVDRALHPATTLSEIDSLVFVGGSATTSVWLLRGERSVFERAPLSREGVQQLIQIFRRSDLQTRKSLPGINPQRADILLAGLLIIDAMFGLTGHRDAAAGTGDLLLGTIIAKCGYNSVT